MLDCFVFLGGDGNVAKYLINVKDRVPGFISPDGELRSRMTKQSFESARVTIILYLYIIIIFIIFATNL